MCKKNIYIYIYFKNSKNKPKYVSKSKKYLNMLKYAYKITDLALSLNEKELFLSAFFT